nr:hypothetical protein [Tanacetum cinerariifolium]
MILNTLDNLGKFKAKGDEGYFIGYSMSSKAFRVFNKRTKRVEENLHVDFLENKPIEKRAGLNWLFDIDSLTSSMNYVPVVVVDACNDDAPESSGNSNPTATLTNPPADHMETLVVETPILTVSSPVLTACLNDSPEPSKPKKISNALQDPSWVEAMQEELLQFKIQNVWSLVDCPKGVLKNKKDKRGIVIRNKARLEAQGHTQEEGIDYDEKKDDIFLSQDKYVGDILKKFGYSYVRSSNTPMEKENLWRKDRTKKDVDLHLYRSMIRSLMYLTASRPDIMFAVCACARHQVTPKEYHLHAVKSIFRYLKGHPKLGLWYPKDILFTW